MSLKKYLAVMVSANLGLWVAWVLVIFNLDPKESGRLALLLFYASLFLATAGTLSLIGFGLRRLFFHDTPAFRHLAVAHRHAFLLSALLVVALILQAARFLTWWTAVLMVLILSGIEYLFLSHQRL